MSEWNANCWSSVLQLLARSLWWSVSHGCNDVTSASSSSKNSVMPSVHASLDTDNPCWLDCRTTRRCKDTIEATFRTRWWRIREWWRKISRLERDWRRILKLYINGAMINSNHIELRRFLEDAKEIVLECMRNAIERHGSVKVNTVINGKFTTNDKSANKSIITKTIEIYRCTDLRKYERHRAHWYFSKSSRNATADAIANSQRNC